MKRFGEGSSRNRRQPMLFKSAIQQRYIFVKFFHCVLARNINSYPAITHYFISLDYSKQNYYFQNNWYLCINFKCLILMENPSDGHKELFLRFQAPTKSIKLTIYVPSNSLLSPLLSLIVSPQTCYLLILQLSG